MVELVERELGDQARRVGQVGETHDDVEHVRRVRFDAPIHLAAHGLDEVMAMQRRDRRVGRADHVADRRFVAREHFVLRGAAFAQRRFEGAAQHRDLRLGDPADGHAHHAAVWNDACVPNSASIAIAVRTISTSTRREPSIVRGRRREPPRPPEPQRVFRRHAGARRRPRRSSGADRARAGSRSSRPAVRPARPRRRSPRPTRPAAAIVRSVPAASPRSPTSAPRRVPARSSCTPIPFPQPPPNVRTASVTSAPMEPNARVIVVEGVGIEPAANDRVRR